MKKLVLSLVSIMFLLGLTACGQTADPVNSNGKSNKKDGLTLQEVFEKSTDASKKLKSVHSDMELKQTMNVPDQQAPMNINSTLSIDMVLNPIAMHQQMKMTMEGGDESVQGQSMDIEAYMAKEGFFLQDPTSKQWVKMPEELSKQALQMPEDQVNPAEQLKQLKQFTDDFSFKQDEKQYILTLKASGEKFDKFLKETAKQLMPEQLKANEEVFNNLTFNSMDYEIFIDKKTFNITALNMTQDLDMLIENQKVNMKQEMKGTYTNYNKITEIKVPKEVIETAQELN
ncbi:DUF6612 family protein [Heyndrickxia sp. NPDC080065]|uniref:DUF6612 family protein n=1 Tax=Heyndrickxia sp. NPDC080065 TaxID=3390568 RepID=UPI003CFE6177